MGPSCYQVARSLMIKVATNFLDEKELKLNRLLDSQNWFFFVLKTVDILDILQCCSLLGEKTVDDMNI